MLSACMMSRITPYQQKPTACIPRLPATSWQGYCALDTKHLAPLLILNTKPGGWMMILQGAEAAYPSMSSSKICIRLRNSVGSNACRSINPRGMPSSSFQKGSQKLRFNTTGPNSLPRAAVSSNALAMSMPTKWKRLRWLAVLDKGLMYSWLQMGPPAQNRSKLPRRRAAQMLLNHSRVTPPLSIPASPMKVTFNGWRHTFCPCSQSEHYFAWQI